MEQVELTAKVLATENISVFKKNVSTAYFDLKNRSLVLPNWDKLSPEVESMLTLHEVGHALFTPERYIELVQEQKQLQYILNVIEDARIERLIKERYQGCRKTFTQAYKELKESDFFELANKNVNNLSFIDRINLYFKLGILCGVKFTKTEYPFVSRISSAVTFDEVETIAKELLEYLKEQKEKAKEEILKVGDIEESEDASSDEDIDAGGGDETELMSEILDENDDLGDLVDEYTNNSNSTNEFESETDKLLQTKLKEAANSSEIITFNVSEEYPSDLIISYKEILEETETLEHMMGYSNTVKESFVRFKSSSVKPVNHLVQQFELKKAAEMYVRRKVSKTGLVDVNKIASYKVKDDIFRRVTVSPEGQNHGMVMLLDWSRSMWNNSAIRHSLVQISQLVMFCNKLSIPFRVYAFTGNGRKQREIDYTKPVNPVNDNFKTDFQLLELFTNKMSLADMNKMISYITSNMVLKSFPLSQTPLNPALLSMRVVLPMFMKENKVKKLNFVLFTDGQCTSNMLTSMRTSYLYDNVTKKNYLLQREGDYSYRNSLWNSSTRQILSSKKTNAILQLLKDRFNLKTTAFFIKSSKILNSCIDAGMIDATLENVVPLDKEVKKNGFVMFPGYGRDATYVVNSTILETGEFNINSISSDMKPSAMASIIKKSSKSSTKGKILIEKLSESFA